MNSFLSPKLEWFLKDHYVALKTGVMAASITGTNYIWIYIQKHMKIYYKETSFKNIKISYFWTVVRVRKGLL